MSRRFLGLAGLLLLAASVLPDPAAAQLGGLTKKARDKAAQAAGVPSTDQPARMAGPEVTPASVDALLKALRAEAAARAQQAAALRQQEARAEAERNAASRSQGCYDQQKEKDPASKEIKQLQDQAAAAAEKGDYAKAGELALRMNTLLTEMHARITATCERQAREDQAALPTVDQQAMRQASARPDSVGAIAGGMSIQAYAELKELVYTHLRSAQRAGLAKKEQDAIEPKKKELRDGLRAVGIG